MCKRFYDYAKFADKGLLFNEMDFSVYALDLIDDEDACLFVAEEDHRLIASIAGNFHPWFMDNDQGMIHESWWWVDEEYRKSKLAAELRAKFEAWGKGKGASFLTMAFLDTEKKEALERLYKMQGFKHLESFWVKEI